MRFSHVVRVFALSMLISVYLSCLVTFMLAYISPSKAVLVTIDEFHEAKAELVLLCLSMPAVAYFSYTFFAGYGRKIKYEVVKGG